MYEVRNCLEDFFNINVSQFSGYIKRKKNIVSGNELEFFVMSKDKIKEIKSWLKTVPLKSKDRRCVSIRTYK